MSDMNPMISEQLMIFLLAILIGAVAHFSYDLIRVFRRVFVHNNLIIDIEDVAYFVLLGMCLFIYIFKINSGVIRGFIIAGFGLGGLLYHLTLSKLIILIITTIVKSIVTTIMTLIKFIFSPIIIIYKFTSKVIIKVKKFLNNLIKWLIMRTRTFMKEVFNIIRLH